MKHKSTFIFDHEVIFFFYPDVRQVYRKPMVARLNIGFPYFARTVQLGRLFCLLS